MRHIIKRFSIIAAVGLVMLPVAVMADSTLTITSYTDTATQDFQNDDTLQLGLRSLMSGIVVESFVTSPEGYNPITFGTSTANAVGPGDFGATFGANDWWPTAIDYRWNTTSRWFNGNILKDITIYVYPSDTARRHYNFIVAYSTADDPDVFYDAVTHVNYGEGINWPRIKDLNVASGHGTKIEITDINVPNVSHIRIWAEPISEGFNKFSTTIAEIDVNFDGCGAYLLSDLNADCSVDLSDLLIMAEEWLD